MRTVPDWWIQTAWWGSGIFATGAVWYFLSTHEYGLSVAAGVVAIVLAGVAIALHRKKDTIQSDAANVTVAPTEKDKVVTSNWWEASDLRNQYLARGLNSFRWSESDRAAEREQRGYEVVYLVDAEANVRYRIINRSGQVLIAKSDA